MADLKIKIKGFTGHLERALKGATNKVMAFGGAIKRGFGSINNVAFGVLAGGLSAIGISATRAAANMEDVSTAFRVMLKDGGRANKMLSELMAFSTKTPFTPDEVFKAAKTLLAFGVSAEDVMKRIKTLGDISAGTGKDLGELAQIFGKVFVKGKIQAEELNQLSEAGVPIITELRKQYGKTAEEIFKLGSQGKLSFADMESAMSSMTSEGGIFFDMMIQKSETLNGKISTLKGNFNNLLIALGNFSLGGNKTVLDSLNDMLKFYAESYGEDTALNTDQMGFSSGIAGVTTAADIEKLRQANKERKVALDLEASLRKAEAAARLGAEENAQKLLSKGLLSGGGGTFESLGGDISGGGFAARMTVAQEQLSVQKEIKSIAQQLLETSLQGSGYTQKQINNYLSDVQEAFNGN